MHSRAVRFLTLLLVLIMPFGMSAAPARAPHHRMAVDMPMGHCPDQAPAHDMKGGIAACAMACAAALPAGDAGAGDSPLIVSEPIQSSAEQQLHGVHPETATPPPRS
jgi:hypothetical protein